MNPDILKTPKYKRLSMNRGVPIYFPDENKVLLPVFKCGYTSSHAAYSKVGKILGSFNDLIDYDGVEKITLIRNPYARIVSLYTCRNNRDNLHTYSDTFESFVENVDLLLKNGYQDGHYNTLINNLSIHGRFIPDKVFKMENLQEMVDYLGVDVEFPKKNESKNKRPYQDYYTSKAKQIVESIYGEDIERFGYSYD